MLTGDAALDKLNAELSVAFAAWKADANPATTEALAQANRNKAEHTSKTLAIARAEYMRKFMGRL
jgi:hypothetical protein